MSGPTREAIFAAEARATRRMMEFFVRTLTDELAALGASDAEITAALLTSIHQHTSLLVFEGVDIGVACTLAFTKDPAIIQGILAIGVARGEVQSKGDA